MFIKELSMYIDYFQNKVNETKDSFNKKQEKYLTTFQKNLTEGIEYYQHLFSGFKTNKTVLLNDLNRLKLEFFDIKIPVLEKA
jgi:phenylacetate-coenzyme A ligase PaaK-like adenylate-forming protein